MTQRYARIVGGIVTEIVTPVDGFSIGECFHPDFVAALAPCGDGVEQGWAWDGGVFAPPSAPSSSIADLLAYSADKRWRVETGGISVNGVHVATDRESQSLITGAHALARDNPDELIQFKSDGGFVELDAPSMIAIATAVARHVQASFRAEAEVAAAIQRGDILTLGGVDAWPWP